MAYARTWSRRESNELLSPIPTLSRCSHKKATRGVSVSAGTIHPGVGLKRSGGWPQGRLFPGRVRGIKHSERCCQRVMFTDCRWGCAIFLCCPGQLRALSQTRGESLCLSNDLEDYSLVLWALGPKISTIWQCVTDYCLVIIWWLSRGMGQSQWHIEDNSLNILKSLHNLSCS